MVQRFLSAGMIENNAFLASLFVSFLAHFATIGILSLPYSHNKLLRKQKQSIEVTYQSIKQPQKKEKKRELKEFKIDSDVRPPEKQKVKVLSKKENMFSVIGQRIHDISKLSGKLRLSQKKTSDIKMLDIGKKITLSPIKGEKITNPKYLTYNDDMRATISRNIKQRAYTYVNHADFEAGRVYVTFVLASNGILKQVKIIDEKTYANRFLRSVALRSIKESNPFPPFPEGFDYPEFTFNLMISFQN